MNKKIFLCMVRAFALFSLTTLLVSCGEGGGDGGANEEGNDPYIERSPNLDIPFEHSGTVQNNIRSYSVNTDGYKVAVQTNGLTGQVTLLLTDEQIDINDNKQTIFNSTFLPDTYVSIDIVSQPYLQTCSFAGGINNGSISADATLILTLDCIDSNAPASPFINNIYSTAIDTIDIEWKDAIDRDTPVSSLSYTVYWSTNRTQIENKTAATIDITAGNLHTQLTSLSADTEYFVAIEATDDDGNSSDLSDVHSLTTIATPNVRTGTPFHVLDSAVVHNAGVDWVVPESAFTTTPLIDDVLVTVTDNAYLIVKIVTASLDTGNYTFAVENGNIGDIYQQLAISSNISLSEAPLLTTASNSGFAASLLPKQIKISICRHVADEETPTTVAPEALLTAYELSQILLSPIKRFEPRVINKTHLILDGFTPTLKGSIEFKGDIEIGVDIGFEITDKIEGVYSCKLNGYPKVKSRIIITPSGLPIYQDISFDIELKLNLEASAGVTAKVIPTARASLRSKLAYNESTGKWDPTSSTSTGFTINNEFKVGAELKARAAIIPSVSTTFYKTATVGVSADTGVNGKVAVSILSEEDPIFKLYGYPALLDDFTVDADIRFNMDADLSAFGYAFFKLPTWEIYKTPSLRLFDTPLVCTNQDATRERCTTRSEITTAGNEKRYPLEIFFADGKFSKSFNAETNKNKVDIGSIDWQVSPDNGYFEINKLNPRKATFVAHDNGAYTIIASAHGVLGKPARKFAKFFTTSECQYGLGRKLPTEYDQYFMNSSSGYLLPRDAEVIDPEKDIYETCGYTESDAENPLNEGVVKETSFYTSFYAGQRDGQSVMERSATYEDASRPDYTSKMTWNYEKGMVTSYQYEKSNSYGFYNSVYERFDVIPKPGSEFNASILVYAKDIPDDKSTFTKKEMSIDTENLTRKIIRYYPDGKTIKHVTIYKVEPNLTDLSAYNYDYYTNASLKYYINGEDTYLGANYDYIESLFSYSYWDNGKLNSSFDYRAGLRIYCGYEDPENPNDSPAQVYENRAPGAVYYCDAPKPIE